MSVGRPRSVGKPRVPSLVVDQGMNNMEVGEEEKRGKCLCFVDWIDRNSIGHDPLIYMEVGGLIPIENL